MEWFSNIQIIMKRIILLLAILAPLTLFSQAKLRKGYIATENGDTISCLYQNGQWVLESDTTFIVLVDTIKFFDGTTLATASGIGSSIGGAGGLSRVGDNIELGGTPLNKNVVIPGTGYGVEIGTDASNVGPIQIKSNDELSITTSGSQFFNAIGIEWELLGSHWINNNTGDTLQTGTDVYNKIEQSSLDSLDLPFLPTNYKYDYSTITTDSRPGPGLFRFNNASYPSVTEIYIDNFDINSVDQSNYISVPDTGSYIFISDGTNSVNYKLTGAIITASSYYKYEVTYLSNSGVITGSCELSVDLSNNVGGEGGLVDKLANPTDTIQLRNDTLDAAKQVVQARKFAGDTVETDLIHPYTGTDLNIIADGEIIIGNTSEAFLDKTIDDIGLYAKNGINTSSITINSLLNQIDFAGDTLFADGSGTSTANNIKAKNLYANEIVDADTAEVWAIKWKDGTGYVVGNDTTGKFVEDTAEVKVLIVGEGAVKDTSVGFIDPQTDIETIEFNKLRYDTSIVNNDTITGYELVQTVRKILYPNDYASYLPIDSLYTTPTIAINTPTKILIPTAIKYATNWAIFDKGGSDLALQFQGVDSSRFHIDMTTSLTTSASNVIVDIYMYKNGVIEPGIAIERKVGTGTDTGALAITGSFDAVQNDYIEIFVEVDVSSTITFSLTSIRIKEDGSIP
jgi:hypothetical protein